MLKDNLQFKGWIYKKLIKSVNFNLKEYICETVIYAKGKLNNMNFALDNLKLMGETRQPHIDYLIVEAYERLHGLAKSALGYSRNSTAIQATELVNELYLYLRQREHLNFNDSAHFFATVSLKLRHILNDKYKSRCTQKRDFGIRVHEFDLEGIACTEKTMLEEIVMKNLIEQLEQHDEVSARVTELLIFWEFSYPEVANLLGISERTAHRKWQWAIAWFKTEIGHLGR